MSQEQQGGEQSTNVQAGRDIAIHEGMSVSEVRDIALDVFHRNFLDLRGVAEDVARGRAEAITSEYLKRLEERNPDAIANAGEPDVQRSIFNAQKEFACSGEEDLQEALIDLMIDRTGRRERDIQTLVLNEAISTVPKLTRTQRRAVGLSFIFRYTRYIGSPDLDALYRGYVKGAVLPLSTEIPRSNSSYQHIEYVGAGTVGIGSIDSIKAFSGGVPGLFSAGLTRDEIPEELASFADDPRIFRSALRDAEKLELAITGPEDVQQLVEAAGGDPSLQVHFEELLRTLPDASIREELLERLPEAEELLTVWDETPLKSLNLTSVGLAIGHGYWRRITGGQVELGVWIHE